MPTIAKPLILVADDDEDILRLMRHHLAGWGYAVHCARDKGELLRQLAEQLPAMLLLDLRFGEHDGVEVLKELLAQYPELIVVMLTAFGTIDNAVAAMKLGAYEYLTKPPDLNRLQVVVHHAVEKYRLTRKIQDLEQLVQTQSSMRTMWGESPAMQRVRQMIATVAPTDASVLILGESGTGKELVARAIHDTSSRRGGPFVPVNMAAMPRELIESTLFGHERGAFTGADQVQKGCCEVAHGGTLFLDEIAELDIGLQAKLLRFLQERTVQRVGSSRILNVDVRIVAATNRDPAVEVRSGRLREDLYYRLNVVPISIPPLRQRREDVPLLATMFLQRCAAKNRREVTGYASGVLEALSRFDWPGNVRQLENLVERLVILARGNEIGLEAIPGEILAAVDLFPPHAPEEAAETAADDDDKLRAIDQIEKQAIVKALTESRGNVSEAARRLGLGQATIYRKIKRYGLSPRDYAPRTS